MQAVEIQTDITPEGQIFLPSPLRGLYGRPARLILLFDEAAPPLEPSPLEQLDALREAFAAEEAMPVVPPVKESPRRNPREPGHHADAATPDMDWEAMVARIRETLPGVLAVYAFGSRVQHTARPDSDLDLAVLLEVSADPVTLWSLSGDLAEIADCMVDLVDLRAATTVMQYQVITTGLRLWDSKPQTGMFECFVLSEKTALDESRAGLLEEIHREGIVHGR